MTQPHPSAEPAWKATLDAARAVWRGRHDPLALERLRVLDAVEAHALARDAEAVRLADGVVDQVLLPGVPPVPLALRDVEALQAKRAARRGAAPLPAGSLFDEVSAHQPELF
jgi:hypothetical protein